MGGIAPRGCQTAMLAACLLAGCGPEVEKTPQDPIGAKGARDATGTTDAEQKSGRLPTTVIQNTIREHYGVLRGCYKEGLSRDPKVSGRVNVEFVITRDGTVRDVRHHSGDLADPQMIECMLAEYRTIRFPPPKNGVDDRVVYPIHFANPDLWEDEDQGDSRLANN